MDRNKNLSSFMRDSHAVDENGNPLRLYHGTADDFSEFKHGHKNKKDAGWLGRGFYFTNSPAMANSYAMLKPGESENVMPVHLSLKNPFLATMEHKTALKNALMDDSYAAEDFRNKLIEAGHDGVILDYGTKDNVKEYVAFGPTQIKSATGNQGTFDPSNPNITKADGGEVEDYRGQHEAPGPGYGMPLHDTTDVYPKDFYGPNGFNYYANFGEDYDRKAYNTAVRLNGDPEANVWIHRAVPTAVYKAAMKTDAPLSQLIKKGDWVTPTKEYARDHGKSVLNGDYKIASKRVKAKEVFTNGDSIHEWGYHPAVEKADGGALTDDEGITAYHGSPHDFEQFDTSKIGTGEGAQAYGHGLYFASSEPVAKTFRGDPEARYKYYNGHMSPKEEAAFHLATQPDARDMDVMMGLAKKYGENLDFDEAQRLATEAMKVRGHMYEVHINAHPNHFLDWDTPLNEQPHVMKAIDQHIGDPNSVMEQLFGHSDATGRDLHEKLGGNHKPKAVAEKLSSMGIKGIKYRGFGFGGEGHNSPNYVVFDHNDVAVKRKYARGGVVG